MPEPRCVHAHRKDKPCHLRTYPAASSWLIPPSPPSPSVRGRVWGWRDANKQEGCHKCHYWAFTVLVEDISALSIGTQLDIAANDQARPIVTTTAITVHVRIEFPLSNRASQ